jgi:DNA mismatch repair protein MutL
MATVRILPDRVANQIAAGEVVERPASAVKELVENALDAGASRIAVEFRRGGRALIRVEDNGRGMARDDALLAFERHATSKIAEAADLDRLTTFGFRGEALPSIASVSRCRLQTRPGESDVGTEILIDAGKREHVRDCGRAVGTSVEVEHLFHPVPARRKFLKTDLTEAAHIAQCVRLYALACPRVAFTLVEDGRETFHSPECSTLQERVAEIFGRQLAEALVPVEAEEAGLRLGGLIGRPGIARATRHETITFVNGRPVDSRTLHYALLESYEDSIPKGRFPPAFLFLECDPSEVDVNVHPAKREVRFRHEAAVRSFVIRSLLGRLRGMTEPSAGPAHALAESPSLPGSSRLGGETAAVAWARPVSPEHFNPATAERAGLPRGEPGAPRPAGLPPPASWRFLGLAHETYAVFETPAGLMVMDRRAAHERIWFERLLGEFTTGSVPSQRLLLPIALELDPIGSALLVDHRAFLEAHGFAVADFGRNFFRIEALPAWLEPADAESFVRDILGALRDGRLAAGAPEGTRDELARLAATRAVRLPAHAGEAEMLALAADLFATRAPLASPSGRPTCFELGHGELSRRFGR